MIIEAINRLRAGTTDGTGNTQMREVVGNKTDAAVSTVGTTKSLMAYIKGLVQDMTRKTIPHFAESWFRPGDGNVTVASVTGRGLLSSLIGELSLPADVNGALSITVVIDGVTLINDLAILNPNTTGVQESIAIPLNYPFNTSMAVSANVMTESSIDGFLGVAYTTES